MNKRSLVFVVLATVLVFVVLIAAYKSKNIHADSVVVQPFTLTVTPNPESPLKITASVQSCDCQTGSFDFGDGTVTPQAPKSSLEHEYANQGTYTVVVTTEKGTTATQTITVTSLGWTGSFSFDSATTYQGSSQSMKLTSTDNESRTIQAKRTTVQSSSKYSYSLAVKQNFSSGKLIGRVNEYDSAGNVIAYNVAGNGRVVFTLFSGDHDWKVYSGSFITSSKTKTIQLQIQSGEFDRGSGIVEKPNGVAWFDAVDVHLLQPETANESTVQFAGLPSAFGMSIADVSGANPINVTTTKGIYSVYTDKIELYQKEDRRLLATVRLPLAGLKLVKNNANVAVLANSEMYLGIQADGVIVLESQKVMSVNVSGGFKPDYAVDQKYSAFAVNPCTGCDADSGTVFLADAKGGLAFYPEYVAPFEYSTTGYDKSDWGITYTISPNQRLLISTFPPREFNTAQSVDQRIVFNGFDTRNGFTLNNEIAVAAWAKYANVMHIQLPWAGTNSWAGNTDGKSNVSPPYTAFDEAKLKDIIKWAKQDGMKVVLYFSPGSSRLDSRSSDSWNNSYSDTTTFLQSVQDVTAKYGTDGAYFDGIYPDDDVIDSWLLMRQARQLLGNKLIYLHSTANAPFYNYRFGAPFVDTYADFTFKQENLPIASINDPLVKYVIGQYNVSNSIGTALLGSGWKNVNGHSALPYASQQKFTAAELINEALNRNFRIAWQVDSPGDDVASVENPGEQLADYFARLKSATLTSVTPSSIFVGESIKLTGTSFKTVGNTVDIWNSDGTRYVATISNVSSVENGTQATVAIPNSVTAGSYRLSITARNGIASTKIPFAIQPAPVVQRPTTNAAVTPVISSIWPLSAKSNVAVTLTGTGFSAASVVQLSYQGALKTSLYGTSNTTGTTLTFNVPKVTAVAQCTFRFLGKCFPQDFIGQSQNGLVPGDYTITLKKGTLTSNSKTISLVP